MCTNFCLDGKRIDQLPLENMMFETSLTADKGS